MNKTIKRVLAVLLSVIMAMSVCALDVFASNGFTAPAGWFEVSNTEKAIAPGIVENEVIVNKTGGQNQVMGYAVSVDMSAGAKTQILAGYNNYDGTTWAMQSVRDQANKAEAARNVNIVAAFNADIFNMSTGEPTGCLVMNGVVYKAGLGRPYFAILKDGTAEIGASMTQDVLDNTVEAISGFFTLAKDGNRTAYGSSGDATLAPRTIVGIKADGTVVIYVADGRNYPISCGLNNYDMTSMMLGLGCVDVINLDGGGSTTYAAQYEGSDTLEVANNPSDGVERKVSSTLFVVSTALPNGEFDHASLEPNNEVYTPASKVQFTASGVDSAGGAATLPADGQFVLAADSTNLGSISADGLFESNGTVGEVTVNYVQGDNIYGSTSIIIAQPDDIYFSDDEVSLGFSDESNLGLNVKYMGRDVNYKAGDFVWTATNDALEVGGKYVYNGQKVILNSNDSKLHYYTTVKVGNNTNILLGEALTDSEQEDFISNIMGTFNGNLFTSSADNTINGTITCKYVNNESVSCSLTAIIGRLPKVVQDFEQTDIEFGRVVFNANGGVAQWESSNSATANMLTGHYQNGNGTSRGGMESAEIVNIDSGYPVRFGNQSLKLNYDFKNINGIEGACVGFTEAGTVIEGNPTGIGMWVYVPEGTPNLWLRIRLYDGSSNILTLNYTDQYIGINWTGWKYVECDLTGKQGPFKLLAGETIRLMHTNGAYGAMGDWVCGTAHFLGAGEDTNGVTPKDGIIGVPYDRSACAGSVFIDNLQFVYGANVDDIDNPVVDSITANLEEIEDGGVITSSEIDFQANYHDVENKYTSGIDYGDDANPDDDLVRIYVDGVNKTFEDNCVITAGDDRIDLYDLKLADGGHTVSILIRDKFGNETTVTRSFTVDTDGNSGITGVELNNEALPVLGKDFSLLLSSNNINSVGSVTAAVKAGAAFTDYEVEFTDGFTGTSEYDAKTNEITVNATRNSDAIPDGVGYIAKIIYAIPATLASGAQFTYSVSSCSYTLSDVSDNTLANSSACATRRLNVTAPYEISADPMVVGMGGNIYVTDKDGNQASGVNVYYANGDLLGTTSKSGNFYTEALSTTLSEYSIYAKGPDGISFVFISQSVNSTGNADGMPTQTMINASANSESSKNITWLTSPIASGSEPVVQYAEKSAYDSFGEEAFSVAAGTSEIRQLMGSGAVETNYAVRLNTVEVIGLNPATTYAYRVGDGTIFGAVNTFTTTYDGIATNFFVIGDTQADDVTNTQNIINSLEASGVQYSFGAQTGDFVEKPSIYSDWNSILNVFNTDYMKTVDMIHVIGNHEQFGDDINDLFAAALFNTETSTHYSVEYGNVYVAVINYAGSRSQLVDELEWLVEDANASDCQWKIILSHQPAYGTNAAATDCGDFNELLPDACEAADIDFVFSGHDHAYARTFPMKDGVVDEENGIVYYVCGSTGEKSYTATNNPAYNFDIVDQEYNAIYLTAEVTDEYFRVVAHESNGAAIDTYTMLSDEPCVDEGHSYTFFNGYLTCKKCGHSELLGTYTGFAEDEATGRKMYFLGGEAQKGWFTFIKDVYYFDDNGLAVVGKQTIDEIEYEFNDDGTQQGGTFVTADGITRCYRGGTYLKGWQEINGYTYYFHSSDGSMAKGADTVTVRTNQRLECIFSDNGKLLRGAFYETEEGTKYYWGGDLVSGWTVIEGEKYYFDPITNLMAVDSVEIDGKVYAFDMDGVYRHEGEHEWTYVFSVGTKNCKMYSFSIGTCEICNAVRIDTVESDNHVDEDGDGLCDVCGHVVTGSGNTFKAIFMRLYNLIKDFFERIANIFK